MVAYAKSGMGYDRYQQQSVMTASPGELTLMLYDGCIKFLKQSKMYMQEGARAKAGETSVKAQNILTELMSSLDMQYEISGQLMSLYDFMYHTVIQSNRESDPAKIDSVLELITDLRDTWQQAVRLHRSQSAGRRLEC